MKTCRYCGTQWEEGDFCPNCQRNEMIPEQYSAQTTAKQSDTLWIVGIIVGVFLFLMVAVTFVFVTLFNFRTIANPMLTDSKPYNENIAEQDSYPDNSVVDLEADREGSLNFMREKGIFVSGFYEVGKDVPEGEYAAIANGNTPTQDFYMGIYTSPSQSDESTIMAGWYQGCRIIVLEEGQYIDLTHANLYDLHKNELPMDPFKDSGMYMVGTSLEAGTYTVVNTSDQYTGQYTIYSSINSIAPIVRDGGMVSTGESVEITLQDGEFIEMRFCCLQP